MIALRAAASGTPFNGFMLLLGTTLSGLAMKRSKAMDWRSAVHSEVFPVSCSTTAQPERDDDTPQTYRFLRGDRANRAGAQPDHGRLRELVKLSLRHTATDGSYFVAIGIAHIGGVKVSCVVKS
jgi:hypothetical protein